MSWGVGGGRGSVALALFSFGPDESRSSRSIFFSFLLDGQCHR